MIWAGFDPEYIKGLSWIQRQAPGPKTSTIRTLSDSLLSILRSREPFPSQHICRQGYGGDTATCIPLPRRPTVQTGLELLQAHVDRKREHLLILLPPGAICLINVLRSALGEDRAVSVRCRITLFLQTDTLFPAISLAGAGTSRRVVAWEICSTTQWENW